MRLLFLGDIMGRTGREAVIAQMPELRRKLDLDFVVVNGENAAHGFGISETIAKDLHAAGVDCITTGNHIWDKKEIVGYIERDQRLLRPINYPDGTPGRGAVILQARDGRRVLVVNLMCRLFMDALGDPFAALDKVLKQNPMGRACQAVIVDVHGEANSEKMAFGHFCDGRASLVIGTHTHVPTADNQIFPGGTAYMTDAGMCGDYDSVIGMQKDAALAKFVKKMPGERLTPAEGPATICGAFVETDDLTGLAKRIMPVRVGGRLDQALPTVVSRRPALV
ncbi:MAG: metallophosphoesterase [Rhodospirillales bacterium]|nr:metallophosphoesterase [Rhodospirillales bacterium]